jgi:hypothetical protein
MLLSSDASFIKGAIFCIEASHNVPNGVIRLVATFEGLIDDM